MESLVIWDFWESRELQAIEDKEGPLESSGQQECRGNEVHRESVEFQDHKERLVFLVLMLGRESPGCQDPRVFQGRTALRAMLVFRVFLDCQALLA